MTSNAKAEGRFNKDDFIYLRRSDAYRCPAGELAPYRYSTVENSLVLKKYWSSACPQCPLKPKCTTGEARRISRWEHEAVLEAMRNKTDRNDARGLAQILRTGWYRTVHVKSAASHQARALLSSRKVVLSKCCDLENELRGLLKVFGVRLPMRVGHGGFDALVREQLQSHPALAKTLLPLLDARTMLYETFLKLDYAVKAQVRHDPVCQRLMTVPGIGPVTSLTFKSTVDEPGRFRSSRMVAAHFGLTPRRYQSGETDNPGRISKAGDPAVRQALYTAAHALMTRSDAFSTLKAWGLRLAKTRGHRRAVIAVARKLAVILHRMWMQATDFEPSRTTAMA
jgi:transposase